MSGFPLKPGVHDLEARVAVEEDGHTKIVVYEVTVPDCPLVTISGSEKGFGLVAGMAVPFLTIKL